MKDGNEINAGKGREGWAWFRSEFDRTESSETEAVNSQFLAKSVEFRVE